ncbi:CHAP domain-containing protein [Pelagibius sp.]|uniref:CHAP domain-containing protein n=1 Tax=Pelagibius sp. TaxID=1931238 RepID=UPI00261A29E5|nr:CHAP domain-containing protein [Pelagibius sp.]
MLVRCLLLCLLAALAACSAPQSAVDPATPKGSSVSQPGLNQTVNAVRGTVDPVERSWERGLAMRDAAGGPGALGPLLEAEPASLASLPRLPLPSRPRPAILSAGRHLECVPYTRRLSGFSIRGDAWTWWAKATGRYERGQTPQAGAVMVLSKTRRLRYGHLAYVVDVLNEREVLVHQANWLNRGRIHRYTPVRDISKNNDWSVVQVWYTPGRRYGSGRYPIYGFIYPKSPDEVDLLQAAN